MTARPLFAPLALLPLLAQEPPAGPGPSPLGGGPGAFSRDADPRPYEKVITKDAVTQKGVFTVHRVRNRVLYEIPAAELDKEFLLVTTLARTTQAVRFPGQPVSNHVVRWERKDNRVLLRSVSYEVVADGAAPIARNVDGLKNPSVIQSFNVEANGVSGAPVIDVTRLFASEVSEFSPRTILRARGFDGSRSFVETVKAYPLNIEAEATHTYTAPAEAAPGPGGPPPAPPAPVANGIRAGSSASVVVHFSMVKLPETPMMPRLADERVGYFGIRRVDYGADEQRSARRHYIARWRLDKRDPAAAVSEPVKPIVFYVDPATPAKLVAWVKQGVEAWQPAFEQAGFRNAILCKVAPSKQEDPDWSPDDARYSVIRWVPSTVENARGPHISDPRTGEILEADIEMYHNVMNLVRHWYFVQVGPLDPRARKLPLPDDLMGKLVAQVVTHEVGHSLGLQHNMKASSMYPLERVRDRQWVKENGHTPTLMDYSRFNYVAQPEDNIDPDDLIPKLGPYDRFAIEWGYKPVHASTPEQARLALSDWISRAQDSTPWLRFSTPKAQGSDPGENTEAVGDADAVRATALGLKNLERVMDMLVPAVEDKGRPYDDLEEVYGRVLGQWSREMGHVVSLIGGMNSQQKHFGQAGVVFTPVERARQAEAVKFLIDNAFRTPALLIRPEILRRIEPAGILSRIRNAQRQVLDRMLDSNRLLRLTEHEALDGASAYRPADYLSDLRNGLYAETLAMQAKTDAYRRNLHRLYVEMLAEKLNGRTPVTDDQRPLFRGELRAIQAEASRSIGRATDRITRLHFEDLRDQVARALDPKFQPPSPQAAASAVSGRRPSADGDDEACWPDLVIRP